MATQDEWRKIAHERDLGSRGFSTGTMTNGDALKDYNERKKESEFQYPPPPDPPPPPPVMIPEAIPEANSYFPAATETSTLGEATFPTLGEATFPKLDYIPARRISWFDKSVDLIEQLVANTPPFLWIVKWGTKLIESSRDFRLAVAMLSAAGFLLYMLMKHHWNTEELWVVLITATIGAATTGWFLPLVLGWMVVVSIHLIAVGLLFAGAVFAIWFVFQVIFHS